MIVELGPLGFDGGAHLLVERALGTADRVEIRGDHPDLGWQVAAWCRVKGHRFVDGAVTRGAVEARWWATGPATRPVPLADARWGLAARSADVEQGLAPFSYGLVDRDEVWCGDFSRLYRQAAAAQWDPDALPWGAVIAHPDEVEDAVVQVMTFLIENETAALLVPARFLTQVSPVFRETLQLLSITAADEARHLEVFTRRALLRRPRLGTSSVGGQTSLRTLVEEPDFALAFFLLSVLGEGSFLVLLRFLVHHGPDPLTREVCRLAAIDEARHVAASMAHLEHHLRADPSLRGRLTGAVERRADTLRHTSGLNADVFDALVVIAAGGFAHERIAEGWAAVLDLSVGMDQGRRARMLKLGFSEEEATRLSGLHTRNFM